MYEALIEHIQPVYSTKCIWRLMIPLKTKVFAWYLRRGVILTKYNLANTIGMAVKNVFSVMNKRQ
jgi:hypothetical protein